MTKATPAQVPSSAPVPDHAAQPGFDERIPRQLGYDDRDLRRLFELAEGRFEGPDDIRRVVDRINYFYEWRSDYRIQSVRSSLHNPKITCIDSAVLSYGLLEFFPHVKRRVLAIHRCDPDTGEECGHVVTLYWTPQGRIGAFSKSSFEGLGHRDPIFRHESEVAASFGKAYLKMGFEPLYFGVTTLEEAAPDIDWRLHPGELNVLSERLQAKYEYSFHTAR